MTMIRTNFIRFATILVKLSPSFGHNLVKLYSDILLYVGIRLKAMSQILLIRHFYSQWTKKKE